MRSRLVSGGYRGAPSITAFNPINATKLAADVAANATAITIDTSALTVDGGAVAQFIGQGQVIQVDGDFGIVTSVSGATINLLAGLPHAHSAGATVTVLIATPAGVTGQAITKGATQIVSTVAVSNQSVVLINDSWNPEFVVVTTVAQAQGTVNAILNLSAGTASAHPNGTNLSILSLMDIGGIAGFNWVDFSQEFFPLGKTPGPADAFQMYTFPGTQITSSPGLILIGIGFGGGLSFERSAVEVASAGAPATASSSAADRVTLDTSRVALSRSASAPAVAGTGLTAASSASSATLGRTAVGSAGTAGTSIAAGTSTRETTAAGAASGIASSGAASGIASAGAAAGAASGIASADASKISLSSGELLQRASNFQFANLNFTGVIVGQFFFNNFITPQLCLNLNVVVKENLPPVTIAWEFLDSNGWHKVTFNDQSDSFMTDGHGSVSLPGSQCELATVNNQKNYWVRARIVDGNYGNPVTYVPVDPQDTSKGYQIQAGTGNVRAPILSNFSLDYATTPTAPALISQNGFLFVDETAANTQGFSPFVSTTELKPISHADPEPAFYLGFDAAFPQQPVKLYVDAAPRSFSGSVLRETSLAPSLLADLPTLRWEYFNGTAWSLLSVLDETNNLTEPGALEFLTPTDFQPLARFDASPRYWIRARSSRNDPFDTQELDGVYLNTTTAIQAITIQNELLGSSNGESAQTFRFSRSPVLSGQQLQVREPEQPSGVELAELLAEEGGDAVEQRLNTITQQREFWVRWHEVENFLASAPYSRHYTLDHATGTVTFGDGQNGLVPPLATQNIAASYQAGGGAAGNVAAGAIAQIKSKVAGAGAVVNPVGSDGGADLEAVAQVEERGPEVLRHRGRAVAAGDVEWLAREAAGTRVARTVCLPNVNRELVFEPGWVTLLIVPQTADVKPTPSSELLHEVEDYLIERSYVGLTQQTPARINVIGPGYIQVTVVAEVVPQNVEEAQTVKQSVLQALAAYLHPLTGGPQGTGWVFGQPLYASKINQLIENVDGVDHVAALQLVPNLVQYRLAFDASASLSSLLAEGSGAMRPDGRKSAVIAEASDTGTGRLFVKGFKEADRIAKAVDLKVVSASGTTVQVTAADGTAFTSDALGMPRGSVVMKFDGSASTRLAVGWLPGQSVSSLTLETALSLNVGDRLTVFYPFPMNVTFVDSDAVKLTVSDASSGAVINVAPFVADVNVPRGTAVITPDGTRSTVIVIAIPAGQNAVSQLTVADVDFAASLSPGDSIALMMPTLTLGIEPYDPELPLPAGGLIATLDNRVRLPLLAEVPAGVANSSIRLQDFASGDQVISTGSAASQSVNVKTVQPVFDVVDLDPNFLIYSGPHQITMVEE